MAVNVGQRNVPDTLKNRSLNAITATMNLALHTIKICKNKKIFTIQYQEALTDDIIKCAKDIYVSAWNAEQLPVDDNIELLDDRLSLQQTSFLKIREMLALINLARRLFHLRGRKAEYWINLTMDSQNAIYLWHEATVEHYRM